MELRDIQEHAETVRSVLAILGPRPRRRIALMLQGLGLSSTDAEGVIDHAVAWRTVEIDPTDPDVIRAVPGARKG
jgi:hypothetical protein